MTLDPPEEFITRMNAAQQPLFAYIFSVVPRAADAQDILGETNLALWRKRDEFKLSSEFWPWACRFAQLQIKAHGLRSTRDRHVFGTDLAELLATDLTPHLAQIDNRQLALDHCLAKLQQRQADLLQQRYQANRSVKEIAAESGKSESAVSDALYRIRLNLARCVQSWLVRTEGD